MAMTQDKFLKLGAALAMTVYEAGTEGAPSGPCYAAFMCAGYTLGEYQTVLDHLKRVGMVKVVNHCIFWTGSAALTASIASAKAKMTAERN